MFKKTWSSVKWLPCVSLPPPRPGWRKCLNPKPTFWFVLSPHISRASEESKRGLPVEIERTTPIGSSNGIWACRLQLQALSLVKFRFHQLQIITHNWANNKTRATGNGFQCSCEPIIKSFLGKILTSFIAPPPLLILSSTGESGVDPTVSLCNIFHVLTGDTINGVTYILSWSDEYGKDEQNTHSHFVMNLECWIGNVNFPLVYTHKILEGFPNIEHLGRFTLLELKLKTFLHEKLWMIWFYIRLHRQRLKLWIYDGTKP